MTNDVSRPDGLAARLATRRDMIERQKDAAGIPIVWRQTFIMPGKEARSRLREWMEHARHSAFVTVMENWRDLGDGRIECTVRRIAAE